MADDSGSSLLNKLGTIAGVKKGPPKPENALTPDEALERLLDGNRRYRASQSMARDFETTRDASVAGQNPYASILACADSRVSPELCFDEDRGDLFVIRLAGNYVSLDVLASLEYGSAVLHTPLIMVLGHEDCGAVKAAIKAHEDYAEFPGHIQMITSNLSDAVRAGLRMRGEIVDATARENVLINVNRLKDATPIIKKLYKEKKINIVGALFNLHSGEVEIISD